jgi:hypothetical protein
MGRDSLLEFHPQPLGCVHAWGVARARHARISLRNGPFRKIPDSLCSPQGFEMTVARPHRRFSTVENRVTSTPRQHMSVRPETQGKHSACVVAPSLPHTLAERVRQPARSRRRFSMVEKSAASTARANMGASIGVTGYPRCPSCVPRGPAGRHVRRLAPPPDRRSKSRAGLGIKRFRCT